MKRIAAFILVCVMLALSLPVVAAQSGTIEVQPSVEDADTGKIKIVFTVPDGFSGKEMAVYVFNPKAGDENGYTVADIKMGNAAENLKVLQYYAQETVSGTEVTVEFKLKTPTIPAGTKPKYNIYAALDNSNYGKSEISFYDTTTKLNLLVSINNNTADTSVLADDVRDVFALQAFDVTEIVVDKERFGRNIIKVADITEATQDNIGDIYKQAAVLTAAYDGKTSVMLQDADEYKSIIGIADKYLTELANVKSTGLAAINNSVKKDYTSVSEYCKALQNAILTAEIYHYKDDGNGHFVTLMDSFKTDFEALGVDFTAYDNSVKLDVAKDLIEAGYVEPAILGEKINYYSGINVNTGGGGGSGSGNGGSSGGNGGSSGGSSGGSGGSGSGSAALWVPSAAPSEGRQNAEPVIFSDLNGVEWAKEYIVRLYEAGIVSGDGEGRYMPNNNVTRQEFVKMIVAAFDIEQTENAVLFMDVNAKDWAYDYIMRAASAGIVTGFENKFLPTDNITRQDLAVMLVRSLKAKEKLPGLAQKNTSFGDAEKIAGYAQESVSILWQAGVISGNDEGNFMPDSFATRAEAAKMICGVLDMIQD